MGDTNNTNNNNNDRPIMAAMPAVPTATRNAAATTTNNNGVEEMRLDVLEFTGLLQDGAAEDSDETDVGDDGDYGNSSTFTAGKEVESPPRNSENVPQNGDDDDAILRKDVEEETDITETNGGEYGDGKNIVERKSAAFITNIVADHYNNKHEKNSKYDEKTDTNKTMPVSEEFSPEEEEEDDHDNDKDTKATKKKKKTQIVVVGPVITTSGVVASDPQAGGEPPKVKAGAISVSVAASDSLAFTTKTEKKDDSSNSDPNPATNPTTAATNIHRSQTSDTFVAPPPVGRNTYLLTTPGAVAIAGGRYEIPENVDNIDDVEAPSPLLHEEQALPIEAEMVDETKVQTMIESGVQEYIQKKTVNATAVSVEEKTKKNRTIVCVLVVVVVLAAGLGVGLSNKNKDSPEITTQNNNNNNDSSGQESGNHENSGVFVAPTKKNPILFKNAPTFAGYDVADPYGGFYDLGQGNGCELCRWDGPKDAPLYNFTFPDPGSATTYSDNADEEGDDEYHWSCTLTEVEEWTTTNEDDSSSREPQQCFSNAGNILDHSLWGYQNGENGEYLMESGEILYCAWIGECEIDNDERPPRNEPYFGDADTCKEPSWWSCRQGFIDIPEETIFHTGLGYWDYIVAGDDSSSSFWVRLNPKLSTHKPLFDNFDWVDRFGGYMDHGLGNGCELCRWDGPNSPPLYNFSFPDPSTTTVYEDVYYWSCITTRVLAGTGGGAWPPMETQPAPCYESSLFSDSGWGYQTIQNGQYQVGGVILHCAWIGDCFVDWHVQPPRSELYFNGYNCLSPSWWSCRQGPQDDPAGTSIFNTGLGYWDDTADSGWAILNPELSSLASLYSNFGTADPYGGYMDLGAGNGCEMCRWDGPADAPLYPFVFPDPSTSAMIYYDESSDNTYQWSCYWTQFDFSTQQNDNSFVDSPWPTLERPPEPCYLAAGFKHLDNNWGWPTEENGLYILNDDLVYCGWTGQCKVESGVQPPKDEPYFGADNNCTDPSWWSCRIGPTDGTIFNTGLGYYNNEEVHEDSLDLYTDPWIQYDGQPTHRFEFEHRLGALCWREENQGSSPLIGILEGIPCVSDPTKVLWVRLRSAYPDETRYNDTVTLFDPLYLACSWSRPDHDESWMDEWMGFCDSPPRHIPFVPTNVADLDVITAPHEGPWPPRLNSTATR